MIGSLPSWLLVVGAVLVAVLGWFWWRAATEFWQGWTVWRNDPVAVMDAANASGVVEIEGTAESGGPVLESPFTETPCLLCQYEVKEWQSSGQNSHWKTLYEGQDSVPFLAEDDTGSVTVDPEGAEFSLDEDADIESDGGETPPERVQQFLDQIGVDREEGGETSIGPISINRGDRRKYVEKRLDAGDPVHVYGQSRSGRTAGEVSGTVNAVIGDGKATPNFRISEGDESAAIRRHVTSGVIYAAIGAVPGAILAALVAGI
ncbi:E3 Ubiquitin ligase [Natronoarchaeum philippinense]|uniref:RING-type E3 ubiquitin transferase n=1 Tax=Natronoarchaeum philippinense TaxID=558529 RepID=A0A285N9B3_NATPI|nr:GIDE domain-containing protein [Natronoarchaeum philippinense]SNZ06010.1 E3 Ubiquitin ligase [Natronoarchaeum philippinense]